MRAWLTVSQSVTATSLPTSLPSSSMQQTTLATFSSLDLISFTILSRREIMLLGELLAASERVAATRSRLAKIETLAQCLRRLDASEISLGVAYLSGDTPQGKVGIGYAALKDALAATPSGTPRLTLAQIDETLTRVAQIKGEGSAAERARLLAELFARATVPEIVAALQECPAREVVLDGETIALKPDDTPYPFQETMRRFGRKLDVEALRAAYPLSVFFFDCLLAEGEDLTARPARERFDALAKFLPVKILIPRLVTGDEEAAHAFYEDALARGHEGVMAKALEAPYEAGSRGAGWLKIKKAHTLDLAVIAAEWGSGRRKGWLSNLHLAAPDPASGGFVMLGKTFKGMTDKMLAWQTERLLALETSREGDIVHVRPELVVEIAFNEIQASPHYPGGFALGFAPVKRYREDKSARDADTIETVRGLYQGQLHRRAGESSG